MKKMGIILLAVMLLLGPVTGKALAVRSGGTFNFMAPYGGDVGSLDPHRTGRIQDWLITMNIHKSLYEWDPVSSKPVLSLAEKVEGSDDGLTYTYTLRKDVKFHNGRGLTAEDLIWSYNRIMKPATGSQTARFIRNIKGAKEVEAGKAKMMSGLKKISDYTLEITLEQPIDPSYLLFEPGTAILPREEVEKKGDAFGTDPVGCGPFQFDKWVRGTEVTLKKFPGFYEAGKPYLDKIVYKIMPEGGSRDMAFKAKELDANVVGPTQYPEYKKHPQFSKNIIEVDELYTILSGFNAGYKPFSNKLVRQAINYAIDSPLILKKLLKNKGTLAVSYLSTTSPAFDPKAKGYVYDVAKAKALMKEAGYEKGFTVEWLGTPNKSWGIPVVEAIIPYLKKINITVKPQLLEGAALRARLVKGDFQAFIWCLSCGPSPLQALRRWRSDNTPAGGNWMHYNNPAFDKLLDMAGEERNEANKIELLQKADAVFREDAPLWFFCYNGAAMAHQPWVHGLNPVAIEMMYQDLTSTWIDESSPRAHKK